MQTILLNIVLSIAIIFLAHQIWEYFKRNYTTAKTKNIVEIQTAKYKQMMEEMQLQNNSLHNDPPVEKEERMTLVVKPSLDPLVFLPTEEKEWMQKELDLFIDSL